MLDDVHYVRLEETDSTNSYAKKLSESECPDGCMAVVVAESQTAGRGQKGNSWESEPGKNLTFSIVCKPDFLLAPEQFVLSQIMALSLRDALSEYMDDVAIKWPNDIYWKNRKICGTLIECDLRGKSICNCVLGTGLNVNQDVFLSDAPNPVSMKQITGKHHDREMVLNSVLSRFQYYYRMLQKGFSDDIRRAYSELLYRSEGFYPYEDSDGLFYAEIFAIKHTGHLVLRRKDDRIVEYDFKEVKFVL